jgi:hypothetical protein
MGSFIMSFFFLDSSKQQKLQISLKLLVLAAAIVQIFNQIIEDLYNIA